MYQIAISKIHTQLYNLYNTELCTLISHIKTLLYNHYYI